MPAHDLHTAEGPGDDESIDWIRTRVMQLPAGIITDADLARIGVSAEQYGRLVDADIDQQAVDRRSDMAEQSRRTLSTDSGQAAVREPAAAPIVRRSSVTSSTNGRQTKEYRLLAGDPPGTAATRYAARTQPPGQTRGR